MGGQRQMLVNVQPRVRSLHQIGEVTKCKAGQGYGWKRKLPQSASGSNEVKSPLDNPAVTAELKAYL